MAKHWVMTVGINHYRYLQSLQCAQQDAQALADWFVQAQGLPADQVITLTDTSPSQRDQPTYPDAANLQHWLERLQKELIAPGDSLWVFFSGYGDGWQGEDYLLPIDGNPEDPASTWISVSSLFSWLKTLPTDQILVLLDINRSQSVRAQTQLGIQTAQVAKDRGIATILSCQPDQFSQESPLVGNGLFTAAVLEGLRIHAGSSLGEFAKYLRVRLPQLNDHAGRPTQDPMMIATSEQIDRPLIPSLDTAAPIVAPPAPTGESQSVPTSEIPATTEIVSPIEASTPAIEPLAASSHDDRMEGDSIDHDRLPELSGWRVILGVVGLGILVVVASGGLKRFFPAAPSPSENSASPSPTASSPSVSPSPSPAASPTPAPSASPTPSPSVAPLKASPKAPIDSARILEEARSYIKPTNASDANRAIDRAMQIPPSDPRYAEAQRQIDIWSRDILDLANQRAKKGEYRSAITAAELIPTNRGALSTEAKQAITQWKQRVR